MESSSVESEAQAQHQAGEHLLMLDDANAREKLRGQAGMVQNGKDISFRQAPKRQGTLGHPYSDFSQWKLKNLTI